MKLKDKRKELKLTQRQVAEMLGMPYQNYQKYENEKVIPVATTACKIAKALNTTVEELYGED